MTKYILRMDDLSKFSDLDRWSYILDYCRSKGVKCLVGVIPNCVDEKLKKNKENGELKFWSFVRSLRDMDIAMHGLSHENFAGNSYANQFKLLSESMKFFVSNNVIPDCFIAPNHSYDKYTIMAVRNLGISYISDGVGLYPWRDVDADVIFVPQILWTPRKFPLGVVTFCIHPDTMKSDEIKELFKFIEENKDNIISVYDVSLTPLELLNFIFRPIYAIKYMLRFQSRRKRMKRQLFKPVIRQV